MPTLHLIHEEYEKEIYTNASDNGWGAALIQVDPSGQKQVCQFASGTWNDTQKKWHSNKKELAAVLLGTKKFHDHVVWHPFKIFTDNKALCGLFKKKDTTSAIEARWLMELSQFQCDICYIEGTKNVVADTLSREYLHMMTVGHWNRNITWEEWTNIHWRPHSYLQYEILQPSNKWSYELKQALSKKAYVALHILQEYGWIDFDTVEHMGAVIRFKSLPIAVTPEIEEMFHDIFLLQNDWCNFFYCCMIEADLDPCNRWQGLWAKRFLPNVLAAWPYSVMRPYSGWPTTIGDALDNYEHFDYINTEYVVPTSFMIIPEYYQRQLSGPNIMSTIVDEMTILEDVSEWNNCRSEEPVLHSSEHDHMWELCIQYYCQWSPPDVNPLLFVRNTQAFANYRIDPHSIRAYHRALTSRERYSRYIMCLEGPTE